MRECLSKQEIEGTHTDCNCWPLAVYLREESTSSIVRGLFARYHEFNT